MRRQPGLDHRADLHTGSSLSCRSARFVAHRPACCNGALPRSAHDKVTAAASGAMSPHAWKYVTDITLPARCSTELQDQSNELDGADGTSRSAPSSAVATSTTRSATGETVCEGRRGRRSALAEVWNVIGPDGVGATWGVRGRTSHATAMLIRRVGPDGPWTVGLDGRNRQRSQDKRPGSCARRLSDMHSRTHAGQPRAGSGRRSEG